MKIKKTVLITGVAGFIGSHIADLFVKKGYTVVGVDNLKNGYKKNVNKNITFYNVDLSKNRKIKKILSKYHPEVIIHHASNLVDVGLSHKHPWLTYKDIIMTSNMLEDAQLFGIKQIIFASSANVYGNISSTSISETSPISPLSPYGLSKAALESHLHYYSKRYGTTITIFRYFNVYGPRQSNKSTAAIPTFINSALQSKPIVLRGGTQTRDFVNVKDVAKANYLAARGGIGGVFNIGTGKQTKIIDLIALIETILKMKVDLKHVERDVSDADFSQASIKLAKTKLGWIPEVTIEDGVKETILYYKKLNKNSSK